MKFKSILTPQGSVTMGLATGIMVYAVYDRSLPDAGTIHATQANDSNVAAARKKATITSAGVLAAVTLMTRDVNVFILGGIVLVALDLHVRHANATSPDTGQLDLTSGYQATGAQGYGGRSGQGRLSPAA